MGGIALYTIFVAADNRFGHSAPEVLARYAEQGIPVLRTDELGTVEFSTDGKLLWVKTTTMVVYHLSIDWLSLRRCQRWPGN